MNKQTIVIIAVAAVVLLLSQTFFTVHQTEKAIVLQLGKPVTTEPLEPGLHVKIPFIQSVILFDSRILTYDMPPDEIITIDKKNMVVDNYSKWRILNPQRFYERMVDVAGAEMRIKEVVMGRMQEAIGRFTLRQVVSEERSTIMEEVKNNSAEVLRHYGIELIDVRIKRTDLPPENELAIFNRMRAERERQAKQYRSEGEEEGKKIRSKADKDREVILADARKNAEVLRGQADANATRIYAEALEQSPDFYAFKRSLDAYVRSFQNNTRMIMTPESEFFNYLH